MIRRWVLPLALAGALAPAAPAGAARGAEVPVAHAAGGEAVAVIPAVVRTRVQRAERSLDRLSDYVDDGDAAHVARTGRLLRRQVASAWRGAKYYIRHAPPPADEARVSGDGGAPAIADAPTAVLAVFQLHDDVVSGVVELSDGARASVARAMRTTLFSVLDLRDTAVEDVHTLAPPEDQDDALVTVRARAAGDEEGATFGTAMPQVAVMLDDEMQLIDAVRSDAVDLAAAAKTILRDAANQIELTKRKVDGYWPPVDPDD